DAKETAVDQHPENQDVAAAAQSENKVEDDFFFDLLSFSRNTDRAAEPEQINIDDVAASISSGPAPDSPLPTEAFENKAPVNEEVASAPQKKKKKKSDLVKNDVKISEHNQHAKLIFIISMILLFLPALAVVLAVLALFVIAAAATLLALGVMSVAIVAVVVVGVLLAMVGAAYGAVNLLTGEGFAVVAGQYELGLGVAIAGVTIIVSSLLYSGVTDLVPYVFKKMRQLFMFLAKKVKKLIVWLYKYSTQL
ncbi:MAG: hypothetical protein IJY89_01215, partial [Clostridia bacterium]|nr:hypothetical protein [Clostridia bacterium]